jgi:hypothetical protein
LLGPRKSFAVAINSRPCDDALVLALGHPWFHSRNPITCEAAQRGSSPNVPHQYLDNHRYPSRALCYYSVHNARKRDFAYVGVERVQLPAALAEVADEPVVALVLLLVGGGEGQQALEN